jgi:hypothetical protein
VDRQYSVVQFFANQTYRYVLRYVTALHAMQAAELLIESVDARVGSTRRVIITDADDFTNFEWKFGEGVTYPLNDVTRKDSNE